jgi:hypothetical protein
MTTAGYSEPWLLWMVVGEHQLIELAKAVGNFAALEVDGELAFLHIDARYDAEIPVVDVLVVVVLVFSFRAHQVKVRAAVQMSSGVRCP